MDIEQRTIQLLASWSKLDTRDIVSALKHIKNADAYTEIRIPKKSGGVRIIHKPCHVLMNVQQGILHVLYRWHCDERMFGYIPGKSAVQNAFLHIRRGNHPRIPKWVVRIDLKDAFPSVTTELVDDMFSTMFHHEKVYYFQLDGPTRHQIYKKFVEIMLLLTTHRGCIPQGAPTSGYLLNLALLHTGVIQEIAEELEYYCRSWDSPPIFTVYADDIIISSRRRRISTRLKRKIIYIIEKSGWFFVNREKQARIRSLDTAIQITGAKLTQGRYGLPKLTLSKKRLKKWRGIIRRANCMLRGGATPTRDVDGFTFSDVVGMIGWIREVCCRDLNVTDQDDPDTSLPSSVRVPIQTFEKLWKEKTHYRPY